MKAEDEILVAGWRFGVGIVALATVTFFLGDRLQGKFLPSLALFASTFVYFLFVARNLGRNVNMKMSDIGIYCARFFLHPASPIALLYMLALILIADRE